MATYLDLNPDLTPTQQSLKEEMHRFAAEVLRPASIELDKLADAEDVIKKGSIAIDGISLTVADVDKKGFSIAMIPHTAKLTTLGFKSAGDSINLETDLIGKYVERLLAGRVEDGVSLELLRKSGFA